MRDILKTIFVIIGTMIGAGFASGQEIYLFFNRYGTMGILGLIISCSLAGIIIYKVFQGRRSIFGVSRSYDFEISVDFF